MRMDFLRLSRVSEKMKTHLQQVLTQRQRPASVPLSEAEGIGVEEEARMATAFPPQRPGWYRV